MSFIDQNANFGLIVLIAILAISLVTVTLYYQDKFQSLNGQFTAKMSELNSTESELISAKAILDKTKKDLGLKEAREEDLSGRFLEQKDTLESLSQKVSDLEETNKRQTEDLKTKADSIANLNSQLEAKKARVDELQAQVDQLKAQLGQ